MESYLVLLATIVSLATASAVIVILLTAFFHGLITKNWEAWLMVTNTLFMVTKTIFPGRANNRKDSEE